MRATIFSRQLRGAAAAGALLTVGLLAGGAGATGVSGSWSAVAPLPAPTYGLAAAAANGRIYAMGGSDENGTVLKTNAAYDPATNTWAAAAQLPVERIRSHPVTGPDGRIYVVGGRNDGLIPVDAVDVYDPVAGTWSTPTSVPTHRGDPAAAFGGDGRLYVLGGCCNPSGYFNTNEAYDPAANSWSTAAPLPVAVTLAQAVTGPDGRIYVIGGADNTGPFTGVQIYDPATNTWSMGANGPAVVGAAQAAVVGTGGLIYVLGGASAGEPSSLGFVYDPTTDAWSGVGGCPAMTARRDLAAAALGGRVYAIGGDANLNVLSTVESLAPSVSGGGAISVSPDEIGQGGVLDATIAGSGFAAGATISFCPADGLEAVNTTVPRPTKIKSTLHAADDATVGPRTVVVTFPDGTTSSCAGCLTVNPGPKPTSTAPSSLPLGAHMDVNVFGSGFQNGATVGFNCAVPLPGCASGVTVNSTTFAGPTRLVVNVTVSASTVAATRRVVVTNPDAGKGTCSCFAVDQQAKLAFVTDRDGNDEIYAVNPNGSGLVNLTNDPASDGFMLFGEGAAWSPDDTRLLFQSDRAAPGQQSDLFLMNADGTGTSELTFGRSDLQPNWSPDGRKIAYSCSFDVCTINADGSGQAQLTHSAAAGFNAGDPSWSPDGREILFDEAGKGGSFDIWTMNADGSGQRNLTNEAACADLVPSWSPDGTKILFLRECTFTVPNIWVMNADGSGQTQLTSDPAGAFGLQWSPDGTKIAYVAGGSNDDIWVMNADGGHKIRLTTSAADDTSPQWSPDGSSIAYVTQRYCPLPKRKDNEVFVMNARGGAQTDVSNSCADDTSPTWQH